MQSLLQSIVQATLSFSPNRSLAPATIFNLSAPPTTRHRDTISHGVPRDPNRTTQPLHPLPGQVARLPILLEVSSINLIWRRNLYPVYDG
ncbi:hypothetical protein E4U61_000154 [Claviceps capensis]|nr:hypothetical protein E4U61_000154 [Claviceps capensis]